MLHPFNTSFENHAPQWLDFGPNIIPSWPMLAHLDGSWPHERRKNATRASVSEFLDFPKPREIQNFGPPGVALQPSGPGFGGGRLPKHGFRVEGVAIFWFSRGARKNGSP